jgi:ubiquinone/menaquinone biosynthesis C-methylase UbiE
VRDHWFEDVAAHARSAYLRYSFTKGTAQEVGFLCEALPIEPGMRVLDVGCGPGRHAHALAERGIEVHGIDISHDFVELARAGAPNDRATFERLDARALPFDGEFDVAISLCQGAFGLIGGDDDGQVLAGMARAVRPGTGVVCVSAFSAYFQVRYLEDFDTFDAGAGVNHEVATVRDEAGTEAQFDLWTTCFTPRELRLLARAAGLTVRDVWSVTPGSYAKNPPTIDLPEFLLVADRTT